MQSINNFKTVTKITGDLTLTLNLEEAAMLRLIIGGLCASDDSRVFIFNLYNELGQHQEVRNETGKLLGKYKCFGEVKKLL